MLIEEKIVIIPFECTLHSEILKMSSSALNAVRNLTSVKKWNEIEQLCIPKSANRAKKSKHNVWYDKEILPSGSQLLSETSMCFVWFVLPVVTKTLASSYTFIRMIKPLSWTVWHLSPDYICHLWVYYIRGVWSVFIFVKVQTDTARITELFFWHQFATETWALHSELWLLVAPVI